MFVPCFIEQVDRNKRTVPMFDWFLGGDMENTRGCIVLQGKCQEINYF